MHGSLAAVDLSSRSYSRLTQLPNTNPKTLASAPPTYDEEMGLTFAQNFTSLAYNVTAIVQNDTDGYGPAYLLNGLSDQGYWFQEGISWNWPLSSGGYNAGFNFNYEVFNQTGLSIYPAGGSGGLTAFTGTINSGDIVALKLYISGGVVFMSADDLNTSAFAAQNYNASGSATFIGLSGARNSLGYFTGIMTEQFHSAAYFGPYSQVTYTESLTPISTATMWIYESGVFSGSSPEVNYSSNPSILQHYTSNGTVVESDGYEFVTGTTVVDAVTLSFNVQYGGSAYQSPTLTYYSLEKEHVVPMNAQPTVYYMDDGSLWSTLGILPGSNSQERWIAQGAVQGMAKSGETSQLYYAHQFNVTIATNPAGGLSSTSPSGSNWFDAFNEASIKATALPPFVFAEWTSSNPSVTFSNNKLAMTLANISGSGEIYANFKQVAISLSTDSGKVTQGASISLNATALGYNGTAALSVSGLPLGASASFATNPVSLFYLGTPDALTISVPISTSPGTYNITVGAGAGGLYDSQTCTLEVVKAVSLTVKFSSNDQVSVLPEFNYTYNGVNKPLVLSTTPQMVYADDGSSWNASQVINGSLGERWVSNTAGGIASVSQNMDFAYVHQYLVGFDYSFVGSAPDSSPQINYTSLGLQTSIYLNTTVSREWVDSGTTFGYSKSIAANSSQERWQADSPNLTTIVNSSTVTIQYHQQFLVRASYGVLGGGSGFTPPQISFASDGGMINSTLTQETSNYWSDYNSNWSVPAFLSGSASQERWISVSSNRSGVVDSPLTISPSYQNQYHVLVTSADAGAGLLQPSSGWYNSTETLQFSASPDTGWQFVRWTGSEIPSNGTVVISAPLNETADFNAAVVLSVGSGGQITYGGTKIAASETLYVSPGTQLTLSATSSSFFDEFAGWKVENAHVSSAPSYTVLITGPTTVSASFAVNYAVIGLVGASVFGAIIAGVFILVKKGKLTLGGPEEAGGKRDGPEVDADNDPSW